MVETLMNQGITALKAHDNTSAAALKAQGMLQAAIQLARSKRHVDDVAYPDVKLKTSGKQLDESHPIRGRKWESWAIAVATHEQGPVNRGHVLKALDRLADNNY